MTTNYDRLLEHAYAGRYFHAPTVATYKNVDGVHLFLQEGKWPRRSGIFKIHGTIEEAQDTVLTERDYRRLFYQYPGYRAILSALFITHVVLFLGFSFRDPDLRLLLEQHREIFEYRRRPHYILLPSTLSPVERGRLRKDFGLETIPYDSEHADDEIHKLVTLLGDLAVESAAVREQVTKDRPG